MSEFNVAYCSKEILIRTGKILSQESTGNISYINKIKSILFDQEQYKNNIDCVQHISSYWMRINYVTQIFPDVLFQIIRIYCGHIDFPQWNATFSSRDWKLETNSTIVRLKKDCKQITAYSYDKIYYGFGIFNIKMTNMHNHKTHWNSQLINRGPEIIGIVESNNNIVDYFLESAYGFAVYTNNFLSNGAKQSLCDNDSMLMYRGNIECLVLDMDEGILTYVIINKTHSYMGMAANITFQSVKIPNNIMAYKLAVSSWYKGETFEFLTPSQFRQELRLYGLTKEFQST
eukprot:307932_1